jgi:hypothetical protein
MVDLCFNGWCRVDVKILSQGQHVYGHPLWTLSSKAILNLHCSLCAPYSKLALQAVLKNDHYVICVIYCEFIMQSHCEHSMRSRTEMPKFLAYHVVDG